MHFMVAKNPLELREARKVVRDRSTSPVDLVKLMLVDQLSPLDLSEEDRALLEQKLRAAARHYQVTPR
jgi:hypothetical protein